MNTKNKKRTTSFKKPKKDVFSKKISTQNKEWKSGLNIVEEPTIKVNGKLLLICNQIQDKFPDKEFSILVKGRETDDGFELSDEYLIPKQKVCSSSIDYDKEDPLNKYQKEGYNVVIHSHHNLGSFFSSTDTEYINSHFECSVLFSKRNFTLATMSFKRGNSVFILETSKVKISNEMEIEGLENIEEMKFTTKARGLQRGAITDYYGDDYWKKEEEDDVTKYYRDGWVNDKIYGAKEEKGWYDDYDEEVELS